MARISPLVAIALATGATLACNPDFDSPRADCGDDPAVEETSALTVSLEPPAALDRAPPALRVRVRAGMPLDPKRLLLVEGEVGSGHLGQIARDDISNALAERIVPAITWSEGEEVVIAPTRLLAPGEYSVASGEPKASVSVVVAENDEQPLLRFVFPPDGASAGPRLGVWCGVLLPPLSLPLALAPNDEAALLQSGALASAGATCVHLESTSTATDPSIAPPALMGDDGQLIARVEPVSLQGTAVATAWSARPCEAGEVVFGPGCARVYDDRLLLLAPEVPLLWALQGPGLDSVVVTKKTPSLVHPLEPSSVLTLAVGVLDIGGRIEQRNVSIFTKPPMPHVVLNEVLANPLGPEPEQEWIELYNDGSVTAQLGGYVLADVGGATTLPIGELPAGGYALIVDEGFDALLDYDPAPAPATLILRVPEVGQNGLSNEGEPLTLRDGNGVLVSRFPAMPKPKAGMSVMRIHPKAIDEVEGSFVVSPELATPGAVNLP